VPEGWGAVEREGQTSVGECACKGRYKCTANVDAAAAQKRPMGNMKRQQLAARQLVECGVETTSVAPQTRQRKISLERGLERCKC
jgi:hypothetical protein